MKPPELDDNQRFQIEVGLNPFHKLTKDAFGLHAELNYDDIEDNIFGHLYQTHGISIFLIADLRQAVKNINGCIGKSAIPNPMAYIYIFDSEINRVVKCGSVSLVYDSISGFEKKIVRANGARKQFLGDGWW
jgi:hypothetical protein